jgi:sugar phosphate isomerase/epimerase
MTNRRAFLTGIAAAAGAAAASTRPTPTKQEKGTIGLGLGNYGLRMYPNDEAIKFIASVGYDCVELTLMDGYPTEVVKVSPEERRKIRRTLGETGMALPSLLEAIPILGDASEHKAHLERIRRDAQFGHDVNAGVDGVSPCIETHLGGASKDWEANKNLMVQRLHDWGEVGREMKTVICFKGHNLNLNDTSAKSLWLLQQVNSPWVRVIYDYSHYQAGGEELGKTMDTLLPYTGMISIKDGKNYTDKPGYERLLPGDGKIDYAEYYRRLMKFGYTGYTVVEISGQIHSRPGYDPQYAAKHCYANIAPIMKQVGVRRPVRHKV